jgi:hypothetical protein
VLINRSSSYSATTGLGNGLHQSAGNTVAGQDQWFAVDGALADKFVEVVGVRRGVFTHGEVVEDQHQRFGVFADALAPAAVGMPAGEVGEHAGRFREPDITAATGYRVPKRLGHMGFAHPNSEGDRLQQLRAVLPCEVRVVAETHPLFGRLLAARSFKRSNGVLLLVVELPDGSPGRPQVPETPTIAAASSEDKP